MTYELKKITEKEMNEAKEVASEFPVVQQGIGASFREKGDRSKWIVNDQGDSFMIEFDPLREPDIGYHSYLFFYKNTVYLFDVGMVFARDIDFRSSAMPIKENMQEVDEHAKKALSLYGFYRQGVWEQQYDYINVELK